MVIIFDFDGTIYDREHKQLTEQATQVLDELKQMQHNLFLLCTGGNETEMLVNTLGIAQYFEKIYFIEKKSGDEVSEILSTYDQEKDFYYVGDSITEDIEFGNTNGLTTVLFNKKGSPLPENLPVMQQPGFIITTLYDLMPILP